MAFPLLRSASAVAGLATLLLSAEGARGAEIAKPASATGAATSSRGSVPPAARTPIVIPQDYKTAYPFVLRFADTSAAQHRIDLAAIRFATDKLVTTDALGRRKFLEPDLSSFPKGLVRAAFAQGKSDEFLVQAKDPAEQLSLLRTLEKRRVRILGYVPDGAYLVQLDEATYAALAKETAVFWIGLHHPAYRIAPDLEYVTEQDDSHRLRVVVRADPEVYRNETYLRLSFKTLPDAEILDVTRGRRDWIVRISGAAGLARVLATSAGVLWVERFVEPKIHNNVARTSSATPTGRGAANGPIMDVEDVWARGIRGEGQIASAADTGLSTGNLATLHQDYGQQGSATNPMRVLKGYALGRATWDDNQTTGGGHGTHTSGSIVGNGFRSGSDPSTNTFPSGAFAGTAPKAQFVFQSIMDSSGGLGGIPADLNNLFLPPYNDGARVHSNSWGAAVAGAYNTDSENLDEFAWNHKDMVITFSAGNSGTDATGQDGVINTDSIGAPGTAKNCITVGASENYRPDFVYEYPENDCTGTAFTQVAWGWFNGTNFPVAPINGDLMANNASGMGAFSSRGPTDDLRFKPEITAPGIAIISTRTDLNQAYEQWGICQVPVAQRPYYVNMGGTSMSNPLTAGTAVLVRQYYVDGWHANGSDVTNAGPVPAHGFNPSAALVKATLVNGAWDMAPGQYGGSAPQPELPPNWDRSANRDLPNNAEGYGRVDLEASLFPSAGWDRDAARGMTVRDVTAGLATGGRHAYTYTVSSSADPLVVTLAWTDPYGLAASATKLVNNLDVEVTSPSGRRYTTNRVDAYVTAPTAFVRDSRNNVEQVKVTAPEVGTWTVDVVGTAVPGNGVAGTTTQPYALVISGVSCVAPSSPAGVAASASANNRIDVTWSAVAGAAEYRVYRGTTAGGAKSLVGSVAAPATSWSDTEVQGGLTYYYVVRSFGAAPNDCESPASAEVSATALGLCQLPPVFAGLGSATATGGSTCSVALSWSAATAPCGGALSYSVHRSTTSGFTPSVSNRIASGLTATTFTDDGALSTGTTYYYVVRATDEGNGVTEGNTVEKTATTAGGLVIILDESFASGDPPAGWTVVNGGTGDLAWTTTNPGARTPPAGITAPFEIIDSDADRNNRTQDDSLVTPTLDCTGATSVVLEFDTYYNDYDTSDTAYVDVSTNGGGSWANAVTWTSDVGSATTASHQSLDITALAAGSANVKVRFRYVGTWAWWWMVDNVRVRRTSTCAPAPAPVRHFTARSTSGTNLLEWQNPASGAYGSAVVRVRTDGTFPSSATDGAGVTCTGQDTALSAYNSCSHSGLTNGTTYSYSVFVNGGSGDYSVRRTVAATPIDTSGVRRWAYSSGASSLVPPGVRPGAPGSGVIGAVANDRVLHALNPGTAGGTWPRTSPFSWFPFSMNAPAQHRPSYVPLAAGPRTFLASQDGFVYAVDARTGALAWTSERLGDSLQAGPAGLYADLKAGAPNRVYVGTRNATSPNAVVALDPATGEVRARFDNGGGSSAIGIVTGLAADYATNVVYVTSRASGSGSSHTLWCLNAAGGGLSYGWSLPLGDIDGAPMLYQGRIYVGTNAGLVHAVDAATHAVAWTFTPAVPDGPVKGYVVPDFGTSPLRLYFATSSKVWGLSDAGSSASQLWPERSVPGASTPLLMPRTKHLLVGASDGSLRHVDTDTGTVSVHASLGSAALGSPGFDSVNNLIHVGSTAGILHAVSAPTP